jgi:hypothetical protein
MDELFDLYQKHISARLNFHGSFTNFGEDSIRYDFYIALMKLFDLDPHQIILEQAIPESQFIQKKRNFSELKQGRHQDKPEFDLRVDSTVKLKNGILAEFAFFRNPRIGKVDVSGAYGKLLNEMHRLALLKHYRNENKVEEYADFSEYKCLLICITDSVMLNYGNGTRGKRPAHNILDEYYLDDQFISPPLANGIIDSIDQKFRKKTQELNIIPTAKRIYDVSIKHNDSPWGIWVWEISYS